MDKFYLQIKKLSRTLDKITIPDDLKEKVEETISRLEILSPTQVNLAEIDRVTRYLDWILTLPWDKKTSDILDLAQTKKVLDHNHYGLTSIKERILEYLAVLSLKAKNQEEVLRAPILCFVGLVGTGKTTLAYSIAESMGRKFARIPFGGIGGAAQLRGHSKVYPDAEPGLVIKALVRTGVKNPVILLDEVDRVTEESRADIMGVLVELLDPEQNAAFLDHYIDYPFDLSQVLFVATANNTGNIATAVLDRLEVVGMPSYSDEEKITIGRNYLLPKTIVAAGLSANSIKIAAEVWPKIVRPLGYDAGMRSLERTIEGICRKIAKMTVEGKLNPSSSKPAEITTENVRNFLPAW